MSAQPLCLQASASPLDHLFRDLRLQLAGGQVVHEEQRRGALHGNVVHAVVDQIAAHGVVQAHLEGDLELGAHAVHAGDQHRIVILLLVELEESAEAANFAQDTLRLKVRCARYLMRCLARSALVDVHAGVGVGDGSLFQKQRSVCIYYCGHQGKLKVSF